MLASGDTSFWGLIRLLRARGYGSGRSFWMKLQAIYNKRIETTIHLPEYLVVICKECKFGVSIEGIYTHLTGKKHKNVSPAERRRIMVELAQNPRSPTLPGTRQGYESSSFPRLLPGPFQCYRTLSTTGRGARSVYISVAKIKQSRSIVEKYIDGKTHEEEVESRVSRDRKGLRGKEVIYHGCPGCGASGFSSKGSRVVGLKSIEGRSKLERKRATI